MQKSSLLQEIDYKPKLWSDSANTRLKNRGSQKFLQFNLLSDMEVFVSESSRFYLPHERRGKKWKWLFSLMENNFFFPSCFYLKTSGRTDSTIPLYSTLFMVGCSWATRLSSDEIFLTKNCSQLVKCSMRSSFSNPPRSFPAASKSHSCSFWIFHKGHCHCDSSNVLDPFSVIMSYLLAVSTPLKRALPWHAHTQKLWCAHPWILELWK